MSLFRVIHFSRFAAHWKWAANVTTTSKQHREEKKFNGIPYTAYSPPPTRSHGSGIEVEKRHRRSGSRLSLERKRLSNWLYCVSIGSKWRCHQAGDLWIRYCCTVISSVSNVIRDGHERRKYVEFLAFHSSRFSVHCSRTQIKIKIKRIGYQWVSVCVCVNPSNWPNISRRTTCAYKSCVRSSEINRLTF